MEKIWYRRSEWIWVLAATFRKGATNVNSNRIRSLQKWIWWVFRFPRAVMPRLKPIVWISKSANCLPWQRSWLWSGWLFQRFKIKFHLSFVVIFSLPVVQIALRFFYFKQKYSYLCEFTLGLMAMLLLLNLYLSQKMFHMLKRMHKSIVCESVETEVIADFLKNEGCNEIQGFLYYHPMCIGDFETVMHIQNAVWFTQFFILEKSARFFCLICLNPANKIYYIII